MDKRKLGALLLALALPAAIALAQGSGSSDPKKGGDKRGRGFAVTRAVQGTVAEVDTERRTFAVENADGREDFTVTDETKFEGREGFKFEDLAAGQTVKVTYRASDNTAVAVRLLR